jgi:hypothetical protein
VKEMARPIGATPVLTGEEALKFIIKINEDAKKPVGLTPTPKLEKAKELIKQFNENGKKHIRRR